MTGKKRIACLLLVLVGAFVFRFSLERFFFPMRDAALSEEPSDYWQIATSVARGEGYCFHGRPSARYTPIYPLFLALYQLVFHSALVPLAVIQSLVGCLSVYLVYRIGKITFDSRVGLVSAAGLAFYPYLARGDIGLWEFNFFVPAIALTALMLLRLRRRPTVRRAAAAGAALALAYLVRPTIAAGAPLYAVWVLLVVQPVRKALGVLLVIAIVGAAGISPWVIRNGVVFRRLILSQALGGQNLWLGNNELLEEVYPVYAHDSLYPALLYEWRAYAEAVHADPEDQLALQAFARRKAIEHIRADWPRFFRRAAVKVKALYDWRYCPHYMRWYGYLTFVPGKGMEIRQPPKERLLKDLSYSVSYVAMMCFALVGLVHVRSQWRDVVLFGAFILPMTVLYAIFYGTTKGRAPFDIFFIVLAAWGIVSLAGRITSGKERARQQPLSLETHGCT